MNAENVENNLPCQNETPPLDEDKRRQRRREQDMECLALLQQAHGLRMETAYVDRMLAALRDNSEDEDATV